MKFSETCISDHITGDVVLTRSKGLGAIIVKGQKVIHSKSTEFSHVVICLQPGLFAEATKGKNIDVFNYQDPTRSLSTAVCWSVIRNEKIKDDAELQQVIIDKVLYQLGKSYDIEGLLYPKMKARSQSSIDTPKSICSEFVALVFKSINEELGCDLFNAPANTVIPADFDNLDKCEKSNWERVTLKKPSGDYKHEILHLSAKNMLSIIEVIKNSAQNNANVLAALSGMMGITKEVLDIEDEGVRRKILEQFLPKEKIIGEVKIADAYHSLITRHIHEKKFMEHYTPSSFKEKKPFEQLNALSPAIREKQLLSYDDFIEKQEEMLNQVLNGLDVIMRQFKSKKFDETQLAIDIRKTSILMETLPIEEANELGKVLSSRLKEISDDSELQERLDRIRIILLKLDGLKQHNILENLRDSIK